MDEQVRDQDVDPPCPTNGAQQAAGTARVLMSASGSITATVPGIARIDAQLTLNVVKSPDRAAAPAARRWVQPARDPHPRPSGALDDEDRFR